MTTNHHHLDQQQQQQEEEENHDYSYYYSFFQEAVSDPDMALSNSSSSSSSIDSPSLKNKRKKKITQLIGSLEMLDAQDKHEQLETERASEQDRALFESNHQQKVQSMLDYYSHLQDYHSDLDSSDRLRSKRARLSSAATLSAAENPLPPPPPPQQKQAQPHHRRLWVKDRSKAWWEKCNHPDFPEEEFRKAFRMSRATFDTICEELGSAVAKEDTMLRQAIPVRQRVAVCVWRLATGEPLRLVSKRFGLGISTCHKLVLEVCAAIKSVLMPRFLQWPSDPQSAESIKARFEATSGIPNVIGSMYTTHVPIIAPKVSVSYYFNRRHTERNQKTSYSITVQGVVDPRGVFTDVCIGWPGSMQDDQVLEKSALYQRAANGLLKGVWIVGGSGFF
ncbi:hypothetical protein QJS04_geneDACA010503 [Acorus gramineus]|uniref:DDE Tnp4 domain-containing protein n=1 Tax=Acorus gramineus TaxID=55184 RepID=A0AAV9ALV3_ACOGR|nr:hypothetical protein QJS04_geneDACA010503 [Acorus gramineus]